LVAQVDIDSNWSVTALKIDPALSDQDLLDKRSITPLEHRKPPMVEEAKPVGEESPRKEVGGLA
jgi:hypothetical protein